MADPSHQQTERPVDAAPTGPHGHRFRPVPIGLFVPLAAHDTEGG